MRSVVETSAGSIQGYHTGRCQFFGGIPYAASPEGRLRFRPPEPPAPWTGVRAAVHPGPMQPQNPTRFEPFLGPDPQPQSEDSLSLNVWTPGLAGGRRPVFVWIHGGAYVTGSGSFPLYDCSDLSARGDIVCVSINYRLGERGYLYLGGMDDELALSGNTALLDQIAALRWVHDNIEAFGGDPGRVTLAGQSAGAGSITGLMAAKPAHGLFHRAIIQSIAYMSFRSPELALEITERFLEESGASDPAALEAMPVPQLLAAQRAVMRGRPAWKKSGFQPMVDGDLVARDLLDLAAAGELADVPVMVGTTRDEWNPFNFFLTPEQIPRDDAGVALFFDDIDGRGEATLAFYRERLPKTIDAEGVFCAALGDYRWWAPTLRFAEALADKQPVYLYRFDWASPALDGRLAAGHCVDLPFWFGNLATPSTPYLLGADDPPTALARAMQGACLSFVRGEEPGGEGLPQWPAHDSQTRAVMRLDIEPTVLNDPRPDARRHRITAN
ncbi:MAG: carboxylesterase/lipase family protein [Alphaproteobacteria bacterium]|nr:carboxylesterase/lipase family protein [Alphaproteobacteria bacterium]